MGVLSNAVCVSGEVYLAVYAYLVRYTNGCTVECGIRVSSKSMGQGQGQGRLVIIIYLGQGQGQVQGRLPGMQAWCRYIRSIRLI